MVEMDTLKKNPHFWSEGEMDTIKHQHVYRYEQIAKPFCGCLMEHGGINACHSL